MRRRPNYAPLLLVLLVVHFVAAAAAVVVVVTQRPSTFVSRPPDGAIERPHHAPTGDESPRY